MKKQLYYFFQLVLIVLVGFNSCTFKKRLYQPGYHVEWHKTNKESKPHSTNGTLALKDMDSNEETIFEHQEITVEESNQNEISQEFEPVYASNYENANNIEIINSTKQKNAFNNNTKKVAFEIYESVIKEKSVRLYNQTSELKKASDVAITGFVSSILAWAAIGCLVFTNTWQIALLLFLFAIDCFIVAAICSIIALTKKRGGKALAIAGLIISIGIPLLLLLIAYLS